MLILSENMTENYCYRFKGKEIEHDADIVDFEQTRRFNDHTDEGRYNLTYMCKDCGQDWTEGDVLLFDRPSIHEDLRERYRFKKVRSLPEKLDSISI